MRRRAATVGVAVLTAAALAGGAVLLIGSWADGRSPAEPTPRPAVPDGAFPSAETTGVPPGVDLRGSGELEIRRDGTVIDGLDIDGCVDVLADDVTIRRSRITCARPTTAIRLHDGHRGLTIEDVEIDGRGVVSTAVGFSHYTLLRVDIHDVIDGPRMGDGTTMEDSYVHDLVRAEGSHNDALQITGGTGIVVRGNTLEAYSERTGDTFNAAIMIGSTSAEVRDLLIEDNYLDGGNYTVNFRDDLVGANIVGRNNTFGPHHRYGPLARGDLAAVTWTGEPEGEMPDAGPTGDPDQG